jgi:very-short-patch-repair endonuclease
LIQVARGIYVQPGVLDAERTTLRAATWALDAVASHQSAARLHGLDGLGQRPIAVTVPVRRSNRFADVQVHQLTDLTEGETTEILGIPTTDPVRTVLDLAAVLAPRLLAAVADQTVRMRFTSYGRLSERLERTARKGKPGVKKLRAVLEPRLGGVFASDSTLESRLLHVLREGQLPIPDTQYKPSWLRHMNGRVDVAYVEQCVVVEADSRRWHGSPEAFQIDRRRDNLAQLAGWKILRFTWEDVTERPEYVVATVRAALDLSLRTSDHI